MKKLLVVANPFPPMTSAGTTRVLRLIRHLPAHGWEATVLTAEAQGPGSAPDFVRVLRTRVVVPAQLLCGGRRSRRINSWLFVPDPYVLWAGTALATGRRLLAAEPFDAIFSSHPRASVHLAAAGLARASGVPWMADYRDRHFANDVLPYATPLHAAATRRLEARVLRHAAAVSAINTPILDAIVEHYPWLDGHTHVLPNGYDSTEAAAATDLGPGFWFVYTGRLYNREQPLETFLTALAALPNDVKALFVGDAPRVAPLAAKLGIGDRVRVERLVPHAVALGYQRAADALLLITGRRPESMSSKVFEYLHSGRPLFAVTAPHSAASKLLAEVGGAVTVAHDADLQAPLARFVADVRSGGGPVADADALARYDMAGVAAELAAVLERLPSRERPR
ncbi:MAG: glycosyltransferase [Actinobacteria bacterium]|nr:glycosyltransferase [Actinomycetota bacterium]